MNTVDFQNAWSQISKEKSELADRRDSLETELNDIRSKIAHLDEVLNHLSPLAGYGYDDISGLGITDAIRAVLRKNKDQKSANDVRQALAEKGFNLSALSAPMASIYKILARLVESGEIGRAKGEDGRVYYHWNGVTDDEIPF